MKLIEEFNNYIATVYPEGVSDTQILECKKAFFSGSHLLFSSMMDCMASEDEEVCEVQLTALHEELVLECKNLMFESAVKV